MTGRQYAELIETAERGRPAAGIPPPGAELHVATFRAVSRMIARRIVETNAPLRPGR